MQEKPNVLYFSKTASATATYHNLAELQVEGLPLPALALATSMMSNLPQLDLSELKTLTLMVKNFQSKNAHFDLSRYLDPAPEVRHYQATDMKICALTMKWQDVSSPRGPGPARSMMTPQFWKQCVDFKENRFNSSVSALDLAIRACPNPNFRVNQFSFEALRFYEYLEGVHWLNPCVYEDHPLLGSSSNEGSSCQRFMRHMKRLYSTVVHQSKCVKISDFPFASVKTKCFSCYDLYAPFKQGFNQTGRAMNAQIQLKLFKSKQGGLQIENLNKGTGASQSDEMETDASGDSKYASCDETPDVEMETEAAVQNCKPAEMDVETPDAFALNTLQTTPFQIQNCNPKIVLNGEVLTVPSLPITKNSDQCMVDLSGLEYEPCTDEQYLMSYNDMGKCVVQNPSMGFQFGTQISPKPRYGNRNASCFPPTDDAQVVNAAPPQESQPANRDVRALPEDLAKLSTMDEIEKLVGKGTTIIQAEQALDKEKFEKLEKLSLARVEELKDDPEFPKRLEFLEKQLEGIDHESKVYLSEMKERKFFQISAEWDISRARKKVYLTSHQYLKPGETFVLTPWSKMNTNFGLKIQAKVLQGQSVTSPVTHLELLPQTAEKDKDNKGLSYADEVIENFSFHSFINIRAIPTMQNYRAMERSLKLVRDTCPELLPDHFQAFFIQHIDKLVKFTNTSKPSKPSKETMSFVKDLKKVNKQQYNAIKHAMNHILSIFWSGPGCGKSRTLAAQSLCCLKQYSNMPVGVLCSTNQAADSIIEKIEECVQENRLHSPTMVRIFSDTLELTRESSVYRYSPVAQYLKTAPEDVQETYQKYLENELYDYSEVESIMTLLKKGAADVIKKAQIVVCTTFIPGMNSALCSKGRFSYVIIDEAPLCSLSESLSGILHLQPLCDIRVSQGGISRRFKLEWTLSSCLELYSMCSLKIKPKLNVDANAKHEREFLVTNMVTFIE